LLYYTFIQKSADRSVEFIVNEDRDEGAEVTYLSARLLRLDRSFYWHVTFPSDPLCGPSCSSCRSRTCFTGARPSGPNRNPPLPPADLNFFLLVDFYEVDPSDAPSPWSPAPRTSFDDP